MHLQPVCAMDLHYEGDFHLATPYAGESGIGWGIGAGSVTGERLSGLATWSNHPGRRGDGAMTPNARGVIETDDGAEVFFDLSGRTVFVDTPASATGAAGSTGSTGTVGRQLMMCLFESAAEGYAWLNNEVCVAEGVIDAERMAMHLEVARCVIELP